MTGYLLMFLYPLVLLRVPRLPEGFEYIHQVRLRYPGQLGRTLDSLSQDVSFCFLQYLAFYLVRVSLLGKSDKRLDRIACELLCHRITLGIEVHLLGNCSLNSDRIVPHKTLPAYSNRYQIWIFLLFHGFPSFVLEAGYHRRLHG